MVLTLIHPNHSTSLQNPTFFIESFSMNIFDWQLYKIAETEFYFGLDCEMHNFELFPTS